MSEEKCVTLVNMNQHIREMEYAVRGKLTLRADEIIKELKDGVEKPFKQVIRANVGDCQAMGQKPLTFIRQVLAVVTYPALLDDPNFSREVKERAKLLLDNLIGGTIGSYPEVGGYEVVRKHCAEYIQQRDGGIASDFNNIVMCNGAKEGIMSVLKIINENIDNMTPGVMLAVPTYPLYSAAITELNMYRIDYYLDESNDWSLDIEELKSSLNESRNHCNPRAIVVINPGNPTGQVLSKENIQEIIKLAWREKLIILADEVYQENIYEGEFHSFKRVAVELGSPYCNLEIASYMSTSKGNVGECGMRGGYVELFNFCPQVRNMLVKEITAVSIPTVMGQLAMDVALIPPPSGTTTHDLYMAERREIAKQLKLRAKMVADTFNSIPGITCNKVQGAMYAFPKLHLTQKVVEEAERQNVAADVLYASELLENTGICIVPGSGFGQKPGTYHFRTTILPQTEDLKVMLDNFKQFHLAFSRKYS